VFHGIRAIMIFAEDPEKSARWRGGVLQTDVHLDVDGDAVYAWLDTGRHRVRLPPARRKKQPARRQPRGFGAQQLQSVAVGVDLL
jgi:hypothetical protein